MTLTNRAYNLLKFVALVLLPGANAAYFGLDQIWGLPNTEKVIGTLAIVDTLLGLLLKNSTANFRKHGMGVDGELIVQEDEGELYPALGGKVPLRDLIDGKEEVKLRVRRGPVPPSEELLLPQDGK